MRPTSKPAPKSQVLPFIEPPNGHEWAVAFGIASAGTVWFAPFRIDIGKFVKPGRNALEVRVATTWVNCLIGNVQPWATKITFTAAPTSGPGTPLQPSGLIGPVALESGAR